MSFSPNQPDSVSNKREEQVNAQEVSSNQTPSVREIMANGTEVERASLDEKYSVKTEQRATDLELAEGLPYTFMSTESRNKKKEKFEGYISKEVERLNSLDLDIVKEKENENEALISRVGSVEGKIKELKAKLSLLKPKNAVSKFFSKISNKFKSGYSVDEYAHTQNVLADYQAESSRLSDLIDANKIIIERKKSA